MPIQKLKIVKSDLEKLFDKIAPNWKEQILYQWQYGGEHSERMATERLFDLSEYTKSQGGGLNLYAKKGYLIVEIEDTFGHTDVLTNAEPQEAVSPNEPSKLTLNQLKMLWK